jgi:hypothetical protein
MDWSNLRAWEGSQNKAFEELCCQLSHAEIPSPGARFFRKGTPDAGVECYWVLTNGDEHGLQAKFFHDMESTQWTQLDDSVRTALNKHPRLVRYTISLPMDFPDARVTRKSGVKVKSRRDVWDEHITKWRNWASGLGMVLEFRFWGQFEIAERLSKEEHRGRMLFWFDEELFSASWFRERLEVAIANADQRYLPDVSVELPIRDVFRGLGRTSEFADNLKRMGGEIRRAYANCARDERLRQIGGDRLGAVDAGVRAMVDALEGFSAAEMMPFPFAPLSVTAEETSVAISNLQARTGAFRLDGQRAEASQSTKSLGEAEKEKLRSTRYYLYELLSKIGEFRAFATSDEAALANTPVMLLVGGPGSGKTHLQCEIADERSKIGLPSVLVLGEQLIDDEPWAQILKSLQLQCSAQEFLGALNSAGEAYGSRCLLLVDALNEGEGQRLWPKYLPGLLVDIARYPWIGLALSIRRSYEDTIVSESLKRDRMVRIFHKGFLGNEARATVRYFSHYGIVSPTIPPLRPEFSNPLFLRLFCTALQNLGLTQVPSGMTGITAAFDLFLRSVNQKLSGPSHLDFDPDSRLVGNAVERIAEAMAEARTPWLPKAEAQQMLDSLYSVSGYDKSLLRNLVVEGVLAIDQVSVRSGEWVQVIRFTYQRFSDHVMCRYLLDRHLDENQPQSSFTPGTPLGSLVEDEYAAHRNSGIVEALCIQLPERIGRELAEIAPHAAGYPIIRDAMLQSFIWRRHDAFTSFGEGYLQTLLNSSDERYVAQSTLLSVATQRDHPYNARRLHRALRRLSLADSDAIWSTFVSDEYLEPGSNAVRALLEWSELGDAQLALDEESALLAGITIAWFLSSSNRFLRDRSTKALVRLFTPRLRVLCKLIWGFRDVDDPYVVQRLTAAAYGCCMRSSNAQGVGALARVCARLLGDPQRIPDILTRDYVRGVVERAHVLGASGVPPLSSVRPPYGTRWPKKIRSEKSLKPLCDYHSVDRAQLAICGSVMDYGDFARYIIGTNSHSFDWLNLPLGTAQPPSRAEMTGAFVATLDSKQLRAWRRLEKMHQAKPALFLFEEVERLIKTKAVGSGEDLIAQSKSAAFSERVDAIEAFEKKLRGVELSVCQKLSPEQQRVFEAAALPYLRSGEDRNWKENHRFDLSLIQRFVLARVFELGWTVERFGVFDTDQSSRDRGTRKVERIGKKYQWIAFREALARVADNFAFIGDWWNRGIAPYEGPWQIGGGRDIDPSIVIKRTPLEEPVARTRSWWAPAPYTSWHSPERDEDWLQLQSDLPDMRSILSVTDPKDGSKWLTLEGYFSFKEPDRPEKDWSEQDQRQIWFILQSYVVARKDFDAVFAWAKRQNFWGRWMPESGESYRIFLGEYYWSPAYSRHFAESRGDRAWVGERRGEKRLPASVVVAAHSYFAEASGYDCSVDEGVRIRVPAPWLGEELRLRWAGVEGEFVGPGGQVVARDPSVSEAGPGVLLIRENALNELLSSGEYEIIWTVLGGKNVIRRGAMPRSDGELQISGAFGRPNGFSGKLTNRFVQFSQRQGT